MFRLLLFAALLSTPCLSQPSYQGKGTASVDVSGSAYIPSSDVGGSTFFASAGVGYSFSRGSAVEFLGGALFQRNEQAGFTIGAYRYFFGKESSRVRPFLGAGAGIIAGQAFGFAAHQAVWTGQGGLRIFVTPKAAFEISYLLDYWHQTNVPVSQSSASFIAFGFVHTF